MIAPMMITLIIVCYFIGIALMMSMVKEVSFFVRLLLIGIPLVLAIVMIGVLVSRIQEIRSGEEDDLSQY